jgi:hypothetical protein
MRYCLNVICCCGLSWQVPLPSQGKCFVTSVMIVWHLIHILEYVIKWLKIQSVVPAFHVSFGFYFDFVESSFPLSEDDGSTTLHKHSQHYSGKPLGLRRGPGRPRKDRLSSKSRKSVGFKLRRWNRYTLYSLLLCYIRILTWNVW